MSAFLSSTAIPAAVCEEPRQYLLTLPLPGWAREQVEVDVEQNTLRIWGSLTRPASLRERQRPLEVMSTWALPHDVDPCSVVADFRDGLLRVRLPRIARQRSWWPF